VTGRHAPVRSLRHDPATRPFLVIWEVTRACQLVCQHCRADAIPTHHPLQLSTAEGRRLLDDLAAFGPPRPLVVLTGGDPFERPDLEELVAYGTSLGLHVSLSPSVTPRLTRASLQRLRDAGAKAVSLSLDGAGAATHDGFRGVDGVFAATLDAARLVRELGLRLQINTTVTRRTVEELPAVLRHSSSRRTRRCGACSSSSRPDAARTSTRSTPTGPRTCCTGCTTSPAWWRSRPPRLRTTAASCSSGRRSRRRAARRDGTALRPAARPVGGPPRSGHRLPVARPGRATTDRRQRREGLRLRRPRRRGVPERVPARSRSGRCATGPSAPSTARRRCSASSATRTCSAVGAGCASSVRLRRVPVAGLRHDPRPARRGAHLQPPAGDGSARV
jgi:hypothetical protein